MTAIAQLGDQVQRVWRSHFGYELDEALDTHLREAALVGVKAALEAALKEELACHLGFRRYERTGKGQKAAEQQRSGFLKRLVLTTFGTIPDVRVPKLRRGNKEREWHVLMRYQQVQQVLMDKLLYLYVLGLSLRDLQEALYVLLGHSLSRTAVNRVTLEVQATMDAWRRQPIPETPPILIVDGVWVQILSPSGETGTDRSGHVRQKTRAQERVILTIMAVWPDGRYHILHYEVAEDENADTWKAVCQHLIERGLDPEAVDMVVSDGTKGLLDAMRAQLPNAQLQRCTVHKVRGFERYLTYADLPDTDPETGQSLTEEQARQRRRRTMKTDARAIFDTATREEAEQRLADFVAKW